MPKNINGDPAYPIYSLEIRWIQDGEYDEKYPKWYEGLPEGRMRNNTGFDRMFKEEIETDDLQKIALEWWNDYKDKKLNDKNPGEPEIETSAPKYESWCLTWFSHFTFDDGRTDKEFLESFERYVRRYDHMQDYYPGEMPEEYICLMGAQDRWRWSAKEEDKAPCRCEHCKEQGVVRIDH